MIVSQTNLVVSVSSQIEESKILVKILLYTLLGVTPKCYMSR